MAFRIGTRSPWPRLLGLALLGTLGGPARAADTRHCVAEARVRSCGGCGLSVLPARSGSALLTKTCCEIETVRGIGSGPEASARTAALEQCESARAAAAGRLESACQITGCGDSPTVPATARYACAADALLRVQLGELPGPIAVDPQLIDTMGVGPDEETACGLARELCRIDAARAVRQEEALGEASEISLVEGCTSRKPRLISGQAQARLEISLRVFENREEHQLPLDALAEEPRLEQCLATLMQRHAVDAIQLQLELSINPSGRVGRVVLRTSEPSIPDKPALERCVGYEARRSLRFSETGSPAEIKARLRARIRE